MATAFETRWSIDREIVRSNPNFSANMIAIENSTDLNAFEFHNRPSQHACGILTASKIQFRAIRA